MFRFAGGTKMGGGQKSPTTTQTTKQELSPEQQQLFGMAFPYAQQYASTPIQQYSGSGIVGLNAEEQQAADMFRAAVPGLQASAERAQASNNQLMDPAFMLDVANNPYLQGATNSMTNQVTDNLMQTVLPGIRSGSTVAGGLYSGGATRQGVAEGRAIGDTNQGLSNSIADMMFKAYNTGLSGMGDAINRNPSVQSQQLFAPGVTSAVGAQDRAIEQARLDEEIRQFYTGQSLPLLQAQELMGLISGMPGGGTTSTVTGSVPGVNKGASVMGGAATGAMMTPGMPLVGGAAGGLLALLMNK